jgi:hypothetical protein
MYEGNLLRFLKILKYYFICLHLCDGRVNIPRPIFLTDKNVHPIKTYLI